MKKRRVDLPFSLSRNERLPLSEQLADGIRRSISSGFYRPGDVLPTLHELSAALGVSMRIPREAMAKLTAEGFVNPRQSVGSVVLERDSKVWRGNVLLITNGYDFASYSEERFAAAFRNRLYAGRFLSSHFAFPVDESVKRMDYSALEAVLRQPIDLCVVRWGDARLYRLLERFGIPFLAVARKRPNSTLCRSVIHPAWADRSSAEAFATACKNNGIRDVTVFDYVDNQTGCVSAALRARGIDVRNHVFPREEGRERLESIAYGALRGMRDYLAQARQKLPGLMYLADDYLATGALLALQEAAVGVPEETRVVTLSNRGNLPVWSKGLARIEVDMASHGAFSAECALSVLDGATVVLPVPPAVRFIPDETFPCS